MTQELASVRTRLAVRSLLVVCTAWSLACSPASPPTVPAATGSQSLPRAPSFAYDVGPVDQRSTGEPTSHDGVVVQYIDYASPRGGRVPAFLVTPADASGGKLAGVIMQHGMGSGLDKSELLPDAVVVARAGAVVLLPDAPQVRPASMLTIDVEDHGNDPKIWEQAAVDLRRAVDVLLARPDVDAARLGFEGHSFGASMGAILSAVEPRIGTFVLIGAGSFTRTIREGSSPAMVSLRAKVPKEELERYLERMTAFDPDDYLQRASTSGAVLMQFGVFDSVVSHAEAERLIADVRTPKEVHWYMTGHFITTPAAIHERLAFLGKHLLLPRAADAEARDVSVEG